MLTEITIEGSNYIAWAPVRASVRLVEADGAAAPVAVVIQNKNPSQGGQVVFYSAIPGPKQNRLQLSLPVDGTPVAFFVAGRFRRPSIADKDAVISVVRASNGQELSATPLMVRIRKNANKLTSAERDRFLSALAALNNKGMGKFQDFRSVHNSAGDREAHRNPGFLPWHRAFVLDLERELQLIDPSVTLPYWRFDQPARNLFARAFLGVSVGGNVDLNSGNPLQSWFTDGIPGIRRSPDFDTNTGAAFVITEEQTMDLGDQAQGHLYELFRGMEVDPHGFAHGSFTGSISQISTAVKDPLFFLLHCNVDRLWAKWQWLRGRFDVTDIASYSFLGSAGTPGATRIGHNLNDSMWPWNGLTGNGTLNQRPTTAPGGNFPASTVTTAPGPTPAVRNMIDYHGVKNLADRLGFGYDDVPFEF